MIELIQVKGLPGAIKRQGLKVVWRMKIDRQLAIITFLIDKEKTTAKNLAERLEVSIRTIHRDIEDISKAGIPIVTYPGGGGGIGIAENYKLDKSLLTKDELNNIIIGLKTIEGIASKTNIKPIIDKLAPPKEDKISINNDIIIDLTSFYKSSLSNKINLLRQSINNNTLVTFDYFSMKGSTIRYLEPYFVTFKWSAWYVFGYCQLRDDYRLFKLNRISGLKTTDIIFSPRELSQENLDLDKYLQGDEKVVSMLIDRSEEYKIVDAYGVDSYEITEDNRIKFDLVYTNHQYAMEFIRSLGDKVFVLSPKGLIDEIKTNAENILNMYK